MPNPNRSLFLLTLLTTTFALSTATAAATTTKSQLLSHSTLHHQKQQQQQKKIRSNLQRRSKSSNRQQEEEQEQTTTTTTAAAATIQLSVGTAPESLTNVVHNGIATPQWNTASAQGIIDYPDYTSKISFYFTTTTTSNTPLPLTLTTQDISITSGDLVTATPTIFQPTIDTSTNKIGQIDIQLRCSGEGKSHVKISLSSSSKIYSSVEYRFKKRCGGLTRPGFNLGTSFTTPNNILHNGVLQPDYAAAVSKEKTFLSFVNVINQLELGKVIIPSHYPPSISSQYPTFHVLTVLFNFNVLYTSSPKIYYDHFDLSNT